MVSTRDTGAKAIVARNGDKEFHYLTLDVLGTGAGGTVYRARRLPTGSGTDAEGSPLSAEDIRIVAIKETLSLEWGGHLSNEARFLYDLQQQSTDTLVRSNTKVYRIVRIGSGPEPLTVDNEHGRPWKLIELECLDGKTLRQWFEEDWCKAPDLDPETILDEVLRCATQLCEALLQIRVWGDAGLVHRDIKPDNIMRTSVGLRLFDFNIARDSHVALKTAYVGTPGYWAPEILVDGPLINYDARADLFSVGVILWEIVHRRRFDIEFDMPKQQGVRQLVWPTRQIEAMPSDVAEVLGELIPALVCNVDARFDSARALARTLAAIEERRAKPAANPLAGVADCDMIELLFELRPSGMVAVVTDTAGHVPRQDLQNFLRDRMQIDDPLETWLFDEISRAATVDRKQPVLFVLAGNAGDGKSHLLKRVLSERLRARPDLLEQIRAIPDATHSLSPDSSQHERLRDFFAPFRDVDASADRRVHVIAMNTGMVIRFFEKEAQLAGLYRELERQLGLRRVEASSSPPWRVEVVNLDLRNLFANQGTGMSFAEGMLARLDPESPTSIPAPKWAECKQCPAFAHCPVAFNMRALQMEAPRRALLSTLERVALASGVHLSPRNLWAFFYRLLTGGIERYQSTTEGEQLKPCDVVRAKVSDARDSEGGGVGGGWLLEGQFTELLFQRPGAGEPWASLTRHDPAFSPVMALDSLHTRLSIKPELDNAAWVIRDLGGAEQSIAGLALGTLGAWLPSNDPSFKGRRRDAAVRRHAIFHPKTFQEWFEFEGSNDFSRLLQAYRAYSMAQDPSTLGQEELTSLSTLRELIQEVFLRGNGRKIADQSYLRVSQPNMRGDSHLLVLADAAALKRVFEIRKILRPDIHIEAHRGRSALLELLGYRPRQITLDILGLRLTVDLELYRFLGRVRDGQQPSLRDLAQFQTLLFIGGRVGNDIATNGRGTDELYVWKSEQHALLRLALGDFERPQLTREH